MIDGESLLIPIVLFGLIAAVIIYFMRRYFDLKREKMLSEAALRKLEMEKGFPPGTYSRFRAGGQKAGRKWQKAGEEAGAREERDEREDLEKGIEDLKARMANIDTIMSDRKEKGNI